jgi:ElaB/YqjD/DUF883 family membrane-anchored ribosome-binding protein
MNQQTRAISNDAIRLAQDANALLVATAEAAGEQVMVARKCLAEELEEGKGLCDRVRDIEADKVNEIKKTLYDHPLQVIFIVAGIATIIGCFLSCRGRCNCI